MAAMNRPNICSKTEQDASISTWLNADTSLDVMGWYDRAVRVHLPGQISIVPKHIVYQL